MGAPQLALPLRLDGRGRFASVDSDGIDGIAQNVAVVLATPVGSRIEVPGFGSPRPDFGGPDVAGMVAAVEAWEPRAAVTVDVLTPVDPDAGVVTIRALVAPHL